MKTYPLIIIIIMMFTFVVLSISWHATPISFFTLMCQSNKSQGRQILILNFPIIINSKCIGNILSLKSFMDMLSLYIYDRWRFTEILLVQINMWVLILLFLNFQLFPIFVFCFSLWKWLNFVSTLGSPLFLRVSCCSIYSFLCSVV